MQYIISVRPTNKSTPKSTACVCLLQKKHRAQTQRCLRRCQRMLGEHSTTASGTRGYVGNRVPGQKHLQTYTNVLMFIGLALKLDGPVSAPVHVPSSSLHGSVQLGFGLFPSRPDRPVLSARELMFAALSDSGQLQQASEELIGMSDVMSFGSLKVFHKRVTIKTLPSHHIQLEHNLQERV